MKKLNTLVAILATVLALGAITATSAFAKTDLMLKSNGAPAAVGSVAHVGFLAENCTVISIGSLTSNPSTKDKASLTSGVETFCFGSASISGSVSSAELTTAGLASFKADLTVSLADSCAYAIKKFTASFEPNGGETFMGGETIGKRAKGSSKSCAKTQTLSFAVSLTNEEGEPFVAELT
jgi:hypothetical protein